MAPPVGSPDSGGSPSKAATPKSARPSPKPDSSPKRSGTAKPSGASAKPVEEAMAPPVGSPDSGGSPSKAATPKSARPSPKPDSSPKRSGTAKPSGASAKPAADHGAKSRTTAGASPKKGTSPKRDSAAKQAGAVDNVGIPLPTAGGSPKTARGGSPKQTAKKPAASAKPGAVRSPAVASATTPKNVPFWMQPDAANLSPSEAAKSPQATPGTAQSSRGSPVSRGVKKITGKIMDMVSSYSSRTTDPSPSAAGTASARTSPGARPKLIQLAKRLRNTGTTGKDSPKKGFRRWLKEHIRRDRSAEGMLHEDETKSGINSMSRTLVTSVVIAAVIVLLCILMLAITWRVATGSWYVQAREHVLSSGHEKNDSSAKRSPRSCVAHAPGDSCVDPYEALFRDSIDAAVNPCGNFYRYACGTWKRNHVASSAMVTWKKFASNAIRRIREEKLSALGTHNGPVGQAARFLEACLDVGRGSGASGGVENDVKAVLAEGGLTWPDRNERADFVSSLFFMARHVALPVFFGIEVGYTDDGLKALMFPLDAQFQRTLRRFREHMKTDRGEEDVRTAYKTLAASTLDGARYAEIVTVLYKMSNVFDAYVHAADKEEQEHVSFLAQYAPSVPEGKWSSLLRRYLRYYYSDLEAVVVYDARSFAAIFDALRESGEALMSDVLGLLGVQAAIYYTSSGLRDVFFDSPEEAIFQQEQYCFVRTYRFYEHALNHHLFQSDASVAASLEEFRRLAERIRTQFPRLLGIRSDDTSRRPREYNMRGVFDIVEKSRPEFFVPHYSAYPNVTNSSLRNWIALSAHIRKAGVSSGEYVEGGAAGDQQVDCGGQCDTVFFRWRLTPYHLGFPWYSLSVHRGALLAGLGARVAAALFLDYVDRNGTSREEVYRRNQECLRARTPNLGASPDLGLQAAVAAVAIARRVYEEDADRHTDATLFADVGFVKASQVFFVFGCHLFCGDDGNGERLCNVPLRQSADFARAFNCDRGSPMNPENKCVMHI
ncbi:hypothetical protein HPB50_003969 [Hyalomma asiaticum]|uniref:Uncharacterized protein n=1 Tax=Hyalomma asiaticum TaxID=266040 RepID=A0ACB7RH69_HYAAI|nr:hypothetical protein HPB50_003969 [Hyalomma asiaticum]